LVEAMILCLTEGHSDGTRNVHHHRARVMWRLEEVLTSTPDRPLYMPQLCATVGAPIRRCMTVARNISA